MADRVLREACVHGRYEEHSVMWTDNRTTSSYTSPCLGGREVTVDAVYDLEDVYQREVWLPLDDAPRFVWMIRSDDDGSGGRSPDG